MATTEQHDRLAGAASTAPSSTGVTAVDGDRPEVLDVPRQLSNKTTESRAAVLGSIVGSFCLVWVVYGWLLHTEGILGFVICWGLAFLLLYALVTSFANPANVVVDRLVAATTGVGALVVFAALASTVIFTVIEGFPALPHLNFYTQDMAGVRPTDPLTDGGILHAIVGSAIEVGIASALALPLGIGTAIYLTEVGGRMSQTVRTVVEAMTALPDILAGLFIYTVLIVGLGWERSGFAAACALFVTMTPIIARSAEVQLRLVSSSLREAGYALGSTQWATVRRVVLPTAKSGLATALILAIARAVGETAPVLITSGATTFLNVNPFKDPMNSLPLFTFAAVRSGEPLYIIRGFGAATVLLVLVIVLFVIMRSLAKQKGPSR
jgi:phosphate transport system permease protein